ncbi:hypothetical protein B0H17DRAFT_1141286 [Mycena rosella]|uniref:Uncharacterized protein n=1 Tax=Mycena rosella TaxID=1033263 RepID=A0AAD7GAS2_MYCRO|nr:hypothetical protein B0H17DRAFT_1141286 [Mycena rosella]
MTSLHGVSSCLQSMFKEYTTSTRDSKHIVVEYGSGWRVGGGGGGGGGGDLHPRRLMEGDGGGGGSGGGGDLHPSWFTFHGTAGGGWRVTEAAEAAERVELYVKI